jgi:hypothetical protein
MSGHEISSGFVYGNFHDEPSTVRFKMVKLGRYRKIEAVHISPDCKNKHHE